MVRWTVVIGAILKTGFGKKVDIRGFFFTQTNVIVFKLATLGMLNSENVVIAL